MCDDEGLVSAVTTPGYKPTVADHEALGFYVIDSLTKYIPPSKAVIGFEPGPQAYTGVSGGVAHEKSIISYINGRVGGIMFWAVATQCGNQHVWVVLTCSAQVNEGASGGPNGNGQTTGENSVALANYAAAL